MPQAIPYPILTLLKRCQELESIMNQVYLALANAHASHPRLAALWTKTAKEEANHASHFSLALSLGGDVVSSANARMEEVDAAIVMAGSLLRSARTGTPDILGSLRKAIELEEEMAAFHLHAAVDFTSSGHEKLFRAMMAADEAHVASLRAELDRIRSEK